MSQASGCAPRLAAGFLRMEPGLLHKDPGQLPFHLARDLGWSSELVYWMDRPFEPSEPTDYARWVRRVPVSISPSRLKHTMLFLNYVRRNAGRIDVLLAYHLTSESLFNLSLYKALNPRGVAVLKLDMDQRALVAFEPAPQVSKRAALMRLFAAAPIDLLTVESESIYRQLKPHADRLGHQLRLLPNGVDWVAPLSREQLLGEKQNIVLTVARLGTEQKNTEQLLEVIEQLPRDRLGDWQFWLVGTRTPSLEVQLAQVRARRPDLAARLQVRDFVSSRDELAALYRKARVFCLPSRWESFGIALAEAAYFGCHLVTTDVGAGPELTGHGQHGQLTAVGNTAQMTAALARIITGEVRTEEAAAWTHQHVLEHLSWPRVARQFAQLVEERLAISASRAR